MPRCAPLRSPRSAWRRWLVLLWRHDRLWETELSSLSPVSAEALALDAQLRDELLSGDERTMVAVSGPDVEGRAAARRGRERSGSTRWCSRASWPATTRSRAGCRAWPRSSGAAPRCPTPPRCAPTWRQATARRLVAASGSSPSSPTCSARARRRRSRRTRCASTALAPIAAALLVQGSRWPAHGAAAAGAATPARDGDAVQAAVDRRCAASTACTCSASATNCAACTATTSARPRAQALFGALGVVLLMALVAAFAAAPAGGVQAAAAGGAVDDGRLRAASACRSASCTWSGCCWWWRWARTTRCSSTGCATRRRPTRTRWRRCCWPTSRSCCRSG